jgi:hypothetical protein
MANSELLPAVRNWVGSLDCLEYAQHPYLLRKLQRILSPCWVSVTNCKMALMRIMVWEQLPSIEEIDALLARRRLQAIVFFLDETFEEILFDISTTVLEAVEQLAHVIKLENYQTFTLFECRRVRHHHMHILQVSIEHTYGNGQGSKDVHPACRLFDQPLNQGSSSAMSM